jgi:hypothetical protein
MRYIVGINLEGDSGGILPAQALNAVENARDAAILACCTIALSASRELAMMFLKG